MQRSRAVYPLTILLTLATVVGIFAAGWVVANPAIADPEPAFSEETVRAFYAGINQTIQFGDSTAFESAVADHVVIHGPLASIAPDLAGLTRYLISLHATSPHVVLDVGEITTSGNRAMVSVSLTGANEGAFLGSPLNGMIPWGEVDAVRISNRRVVEFWSDATGFALLEPLAQAQLTIAFPAERIVSLARLSIPEGTSISAPGSSELRWLHVEAGDVAVEAHDDHSMSLVASPSIGPDSRDLARTLMHTGDLIGIPTRSRAEVHNVGRQTASVLELAISMPETNLPRIDLAYPQGQPSTTGVFMPNWWTGEDLTSLDLAFGNSLIGGIKISLPAKQIVIATGQATLAPKATLSDLDLPGTSVLFVNSGVLDVISAEQAVFSYPGATRFQSAGRLDEESVGMLSHDAHANLHNPGPNPLVVTIFAILSASALTNP
jgi:SnoaL-like polyketide cyclase